MKIQKNHDIFYETGRLWKHISPYQFLALLRAFKASIYFRRSSRNTFENAHTENMYFNVFQGQEHIFTRSHLANRLPLHAYYSSGRKKLLLYESLLFGQEETSTLRVMNSLYFRRTRQFLSTFRKIMTFLMQCETNIIL